MAVEANVRKRKHQHASNEADEAEVVVPKKIAKKVKKKTPKKEKSKKKASLEESNEIHDELETAESLPTDTVEQVTKEPLAVNDTGGAEDEGAVDAFEENGAEDSGFEEKAIKFSKDFKMLHFREKLRGNSFITELRHFLYIAQTRPQIVAKYIEKRGKPLELADALERVDKTNLLHVGYVCEALQLVVMDILAHHKAHMESAEHACRYFLKSHGPVVESLLNSPKMQHRRTALKLLTAVVCVEPLLGRQLLAAYDILNNTKTIENFLSHSRHELHEEETVRKCFVHFVLAFLVDGNALLVRSIIERGALIRALASGLLYDDHVTVCVVLSTLHKYVLECADISKTKKIHVFDLECCKNLARLYDWHGPKVLAAKFEGGGGGGKGKRGAGGAGQQLQSRDIDALVDAKERDAVAAAAHEFLLVLLTSRKHGITFDAMTNFRQKHNNIQGKLIGFLIKPWCNVRKSDLIMRTLQACPDLARHTVRHFAGIVNPMRTPDRDWIKAADFLATLISTAHPRLLRSALDQITLTDFSYWIKDICLPLETLVLLTGAKRLRDKRFEFRLATNRLLLAMFTQCINFIAAATRRTKAKGGGGGVNPLRRFKFDVLNHILSNFPTIEDILYSLYMSIGEHGVNVLEHLELTLDLVLIIARENRTFVNKTSVILDYLELLRPLYAGDDDAADGNIQLELKAIKTILMLFPKALQPQEPLFRSVLVSFVKAYVQGEHAVRHEAGTLLRGILRNTGLFDSGELEIDLWLAALHFVDAEAVDVVTQTLIEVLQVTKAEVDAPKCVETAVNTANLRRLFANIEQGLSVHADIETLAISKLMPLIFKGVAIAPPLDQYLETVCLLMFHYHPSPEQVLGVYAMELTALQPYMHSWLPLKASSKRSKKKPKPFLSLESVDVAAGIPHMRALQSAILAGVEGSFEQTFSADSGSYAAFEIEVNGKLLRLSCVLQSERTVMLYAQQVVFVVAQLVAQQCLQRAQAESAAACLIACISLVHKLGTDAAAAADASDATAAEDDGERSFLDILLQYIFGVRLGYVRSASLFGDAATGDDEESHLNYLRFLRTLTQHCNALEPFDAHTANYRLKLVKAVRISLQSSETRAEARRRSESLREAVALVRAFNMHEPDCVEMLELLLGEQLRSNDFFVDDTATCQQWSVYYELLVTVLQRLAALRRAVRCDAFVQRLPQLYAQLVRQAGSDGNLEQLDEALHDFLRVSHHCIARLEEPLFFDCMFAERKLSKQGIRLACLLLERDPRLDAAFERLLPTHIGKKELVYPLLDIAFRAERSPNAALLPSVYQAYKNGFMKTIEKPQKAGVIYKEHVACSIALIEHCMPRSECVDFCNKQFKFDVIEPFQLRIVRAIYAKALRALLAESAAEESTAAVAGPAAGVFVNFVHLQVQMLGVDLKKQLLDVAKLEQFGHGLFAWWQEAPATLLAQLDFSKVLHGQQWLNVCKSCLRIGMQVGEAVDEALARADAANGLLLRLLAFLCERMYADADAETAADAPPEPAQLFEMIFTHSKFHDIVLGQRASGMHVKTAVLQLLYTLAKKCPAALAESQIPVILGAYQARLSDADRYALALLQLYELHNCALHRYRPLVWGESAVAHYALRSAVDERAKLKQQETSVAQVMALVDRQLCEYTLRNFPVWRKLNAAAQMPVVDFPDPELRPRIHFGTNNIERRIERGNVATAPPLSIAEMRMCPKRDGVYEACYDPAFFVPLMSMCFSPEAYAHPARPVQNGLLAVTFAALSSQDRDMRRAAGCVQLRYRAHFEQKRFLEQPLWVQAYENIQSGLSELRDAWMKHKRNSGTPRVPYISGLFVARSLNLTVEPQHLLYKQLMMYLRLKSTFNFQTVPEFNLLFYSAEVEHQVFRQFIVEVIRDGLKTSADLFLLVATNTFKVLMGFYGSAIATLDMNLLILSVFSTCAKIPATAKLMIETVGLLPWLDTVIGSLEFYHFDVIAGVISILSNQWYSLQASADEFHNFAHLAGEMHRLVVSLLPLLSPRIAVTHFAKLLCILQRTANTKNAQHLAVSDVQLNRLITCAEVHYPTLLDDVASIRDFGDSGAESEVDYCRRLHLQQEPHVDPTAIQALASLRAYVIDWWRCRNAKETGDAQLAQEGAATAPILRIS